jgi:hypothetical protein
MEGSMNVHRVASHAAFWCGVVALVGCAKGDNKPADSTTAMAPAAANTTSTPSSATATSTSAGAVAAPIVIADLAGKWKSRAVPTSGTDTSATETTLTATGTTTGWKITYANGLVVPQTVTVAGDSVVLESAAPYKSVRRKGVMVTTHSVYRKEGDKLVGTVTAHYKTKGADSVLVLKSEGTKQP